MRIGGLSDSGVWQHTIIYLLTGILQKAGGILLLPILVASLPPSDFTRYGLYVSLLQILARGASLNLQSAPTRLVFDYEHARTQASLLRTTLWGAIGIAGGLMLIAISVVQVGGIADPITRGRFNIVILVFVSVLGTISVDHGLALFRVYQEPRLFSIASISKSIGPVLLYLSAIFLVKESFETVVAAYAIALSITGGATLFTTWYRRADGTIDMDMMREAIRFAAPTALSFIALWVVSVSGRWIGTLFVSLEELAGYTLLTFIVTGAGMAGRALFDARIPDIGNAFSKKEIKRGRSIIWNTTAISVGLVVAGFSVAFIAINTVGHHVPEAYRPTNTLLGIAFIASLFDCLYLYGLQSLVAMKRTEMLPIATGSGAVAVIILSFLLTYFLGPTGLVIAMAFGYFLQAGIAVLMVKRVYRQYNFAL